MFRSIKISIKIHGVMHVQISRVLDLFFLIVCTIVKKCFKLILSLEFVYRSNLIILQYLNFLIHKILKFLQIYKFCESFSILDFLAQTFQLMIML